MRKHDLYLWSTLAFALFSHCIAFFQFSIGAGNLNVPERWSGQFAILIGMSLLFAFLQFFFNRNRIVVYISFLVRAFLLIIVTFPQGSSMNVRTTLLASLVFETMIDVPFFIGSFLCTALILLAVFIRWTGPELGPGERCDLLRRPAVHRILPFHDRDACAS